MKPTAMKVAQSMKKQYHSNLLSNPMVVTKAISKAIDSNKPKPRYLIGFAAKPLVFLHAILPTKVFDKMMKTSKFNLTNRNIIIRQIVYIRHLDSSFKCETMLRVLFFILFQHLQCIKN